MKIIFFRIIAVISVASALLSLEGCTRSGDGGTQSKETASAESHSSKDANVKMNERSAEFPEILGELGQADVLSNEIFTTFDDAAIMVEPEKQPFDGYKCTACFAESYYIFMTDEGYGLLNYNGEELIVPQGVNKIYATAKDLLCVELSDGSSSYYRTMSGGIYKIDDVIFDKNRISFMALNGGDEDLYDTQHFVIALDGEVIYDSKWIGFEEVDPKSLETAKSCAAVYSAWNGVGKYYLVFDRFCNLTVYEAEYARVELKIGEDYGECFITDPDDYDDLETLISSFGSEERSEAPERTSGSDYIRIEGGLAYDDERWLKTISADGYCFTEIYDPEGGSPDMYFTVMNSRTFTDLVSWTESAVRSEYGVR